MGKRVLTEEPTSKVCWFCKREFEEGEKKKYVYPVPDPDKKLSIRHGAHSCMKCYPAVTQQQINLGLLSIIVSRPLEAHR